MAEAPRLGRRREALRRAVLDAAIEEVAAGDIDTASLRAIARRAGVNESSVYRRWGTRESLIREALLERTSVDIPMPDTGSLRGDLVAVATAVAAFIQSPVGRSLLRTGAAAPTADDAALQLFWRARHATLTGVVERARARGELIPDADAGLLVEMVVAPLHFRTLLSREPIEPDLPKRVVDAVLDGIAN